MGFQKAFFGGVLRVSAQGAGFPKPTVAWLPKLAFGFGARVLHFESCVAGS